MKKTLFILLLTIVCCDSDENNSNLSEPIFITKAEITLTGENNGSNLSTVSFCYDKDSFLVGSYYSGWCHQGPAIPYSDTYIGSLKFFNGKEDSFNEITQEIINDSEDYLVVFKAGSTEYEYTYEYLPSLDRKGKPIGINFRLFVPPTNIGTCPPISAYLYFAPNMDKSKVPIIGKASDHYKILDSNSIQVALVSTGLSCD